MRKGFVLKKGAYHKGLLHRAWPAFARLRYGQNIKTHFVEDFKYEKINARHIEHCKEWISQQTPEFLAKLKVTK